MKEENIVHVKSNNSSLMKYLHGVAELVPDGNGAYHLYRIPTALLPKLNDRFKIRGYSPSGTEIRFRMKSTPAIIRLRRMSEMDHPVFTTQTALIAGVFRGDFQESWIALQEGDNEIKIAPPNLPMETLIKNRFRYHPEVTRIVLPPFIELRLVDFEGDVEPARKEDCPKMTCLSYGSSITQGAYSPLGTGTFPAILGRELGVDIINLGFGGGAKLETEIAQWIVSRPDWNFATLELGANLFHLTPEEFRVKVRDFLHVFASDERKRLAFILDLLPNPPEIQGLNKQRADDFRCVAREEVNTIGNDSLIHLEYASLIPRISDYSMDLLHPAAHAFESIGRGLSAQIRKYVHNAETL